ncbi:hypothetical protein WN51_12563 [Melipona quadrifasciata]|uniref:Uncharacterized protein n=1 Tax=Melipona quadrifasciata TaxID=166423 RepID=A0A0M9A272_9HYME|nr:hypothetical protein WN51_12563 [Melipona quadrifasciata]
MHILPLSIFLLNKFHLVVPITSIALPPQRRDFKHQSTYETFEDTSEQYRSPKLCRTSKVKHSDNQTLRILQTRKAILESLVASELGSFEILFKVQLSLLHQDSCDPQEAFVLNFLNVKRGVNKKEKEGSLDEERGLFAGNEEILSLWTGMMATPLTVVLEYWLSRPPPLFQNDVSFAPLMDATRHSRLVAIC